jgi:CRISPR-associated protein Cas10/Csm1 subtype III-A
MEKWQSSLIAYGTHLLLSQLGEDWPEVDVSDVSGPLAQAALQYAESYPEDPRLQLARRIVHDDSPDELLTPQIDPKGVVPVFSLLDAPPGVEERKASSLSVAPLSLSTESQTGTASDLADEFWQTLDQPTLNDIDTFYYLLAHYGWNVPGTVKKPVRPGFEQGISVFEQFKAVSALCHCLDPTLDEDQSIGLIAGDVPGIQDVLYTITAKGAAKTLRGHSAYLQLLSDALVRLLRHQFDLPEANVVFSAGGNFLIAVPRDVMDKIQDWQETINQKLLALHRGELYLALAQITVPAHLYADSSSLADPGSLAERRAELQRRLEQAKHAAFADLASTHYADLFQPLGDGGGVQRCEICHVEVDERTQVSAEDTTLCEQCHSFAFQAPEDGDYEYDSLAWSVANAERLLISSFDDSVSLDKYRGGKGNVPWRVALRHLGLDYRFIENDQETPSHPGTLLAFAPERFLPKRLEVEKSYGFRFLCQSTPREDPREHRREIRDFHSMAREDAIGINRYGVLRMDVDSLGQTMSGQGLRHPDFLHLSALSNALDLFLGGMLEQIGCDCVYEWQTWVEKWNDRQVNPVHKQPYVIYAGGDDMFIVAPWDLLPPLAQAIRDRFGDFCLNRLTMSGGIAIANEKYPLYRAADEAKMALDQSKDRLVEDPRTLLVKARKDALTFLGVTISWEDLDTARTLTEKLIRLLTGYPYPGQGKAPRALLQTLDYVAKLYRLEADGAEEHGTVQLGQWLPALHYGLRRMGERVPEPLETDLVTIPNDILELDAIRAAARRLENSQDAAAEHKLRRAIQSQLDRVHGWPAIRYLGLPVRWAEFLTREGG